MSEKDISYSDFSLALRVDFGGWREGNPRTRRSRYGQGGAGRGEERRPVDNLDAIVLAFDGEGRRSRRGLPA